MKVLSLFDGMSCGQIALNQLGIKVDEYYASEIDKWAIQVTQKNYPDTIQLGDITKWREWDIDWASINLVYGGSPCQGFSFAGKQLAFDDPRSKLFFEFVDIVNHIKSFNPDVKFLLENVRMKKEYLDVVSEYMGVQPVMINSALVSAQNRQRYYWTNFEVTQPEDKGILLKDIIEDLPLNEPMPDNVEFKQNYAQWDLNNKGNKSQDQRAYYADGKHGTLTANGGGSKVKVCGGVIRGRYLVDGKRQDHKMKTAGLTEQRLEVRNDGKTNTLTTVQKDNVVVRATVQANAEHTYNGKVPTLTASMGVGGGNVPLFTDYETASKYKGKYIDKNDRLEYRKLTPLECERLQTVPDGYTDNVSNTQRYRMLGNGWTVEVIKHIFSKLEAEL